MSRAVDAKDGSEPIVVYEPSPPVTSVQLRTPESDEYASPEWGLNLHIEGATIGSGYERNAGMGGAGAGLRFKPCGYFGLEADVDFVSGHGYVGDIRHETALSFNGLFFLNPKSFAQAYLLAGLGWSWANSQDDPNGPTTTSPYDSQYSYFGGQVGVGVELRFTRALALNVDLRGFVRTRTDHLALSQPEFTNSEGQTTNTSGGGLLTAGMTVYVP